MPNSKNTPLEALQPLQPVCRALGSSLPLDKQLCWSNEPHILLYLLDFPDSAHSAPPKHNCPRAYTLIFERNTG